MNSDNPAFSAANGPTAPNPGRTDAGWDGLFCTTGVNRYLSDEDLDAMKNGVRRFAEGSVVMMKALDELGKLHPLICGAVIAFKVVINLELKRRENNGKVVALHVQMHDTMSVLMQLQHIQDVDQVLPDGSCIQGRLRTVLQDLETDIKMCGNICDKYMKKSTIAKIVKASIYEQRLADCALAFAQRRRDLELAMGIHTLIGVESANRSLLMQTNSMHTMDDKLNMLLLFRQLDTPNDKELMQFVEARGGAQACLENDQILVELQSKLSTVRVNSDSMQQPKQSLDKLKKELNEDIDTALEENMIQFERKMKMQGEQLEALFRSESDRIIDAIHAGSYDRLIDQDLKDLWKEMGWRGSVKARHFALCLYDFLSERYQNDEPRKTGASQCSAEMLSNCSTSTSPRLQDFCQDRRAMILQCIQISYAHPIIECIDRNGSGFISIREANTFVNERPPGWSLPDWVAYWAVAWPTSVLDYRRRILIVVQRMFQSLTKCLYMNRVLLDDYLENSAFRVLELVLRDVQAIEDCPTLTPRLESLLRERVDRLRVNIRRMAFNLDAPETVRLVVAEGGPIEQYFFPMLFLVLERHLQIFRLAESHILNPDELSMPLVTLATLCDMMCRRVRDLQVIFTQTSADPSFKFRSFASGMFHGLSKPSPSFLIGNCYSLEYYDDGADLSTPPQENTMNADACSLEADGPGLGTTTGDHTDILCFGTEQKYRCSAFESERSTGTSLAHQTDSVDTTWPACLDGTWVGYRTFNFLDPDARLQPSEGMVAFRLTFDPCAGTISGTGNSHYGSSKISGTCKEWDVGFINEYHDPARGTFKLNWNGKYDSSKDIISGEWSYIDVDQPPVAAGGTFYLRRTVPSNLQFLGPNPVLTNARQRWRYACDAVLHQARQRLWSWSVFKRVFDTRKRLVDLNFRRMLRRMRRLAPELISEEELCEVEGMQRTTVPAEGEFCISIAETRTRMLVFHDNAYCDACGLDIVGPRFMCLRCRLPEQRKSIDLCHPCFIAGKDISRTPFVHSASHDVVRASRLVHEKDKLGVMDGLQAALERKRDRKSVV